MDEPQAIPRWWWSLDIWKYLFVLCFQGGKWGKNKKMGILQTSVLVLVKGLADQVTGLGPTVLESMVLSTPTHSIDLYFSGWHPAFPPWNWSIVTETGLAQEELHNFNCASASCLWNGNKCVPALVMLLFLLSQERGVSPEGGKHALLTTWMWTTVWCPTHPRIPRCPTWGLESAGHARRTTNTPFGPLCCSVLACIRWLGWLHRKALVLICSFILILGIIPTCDPCYTYLPFRIDECTSLRQFLLARQAPLFFNEIICFSQGSSSLCLESSA